MQHDPIIVTVNDQSLTRGQAQQIARQTLVRQGVPPQMVESYLQQIGPQLEQQTVEQFIDQTLMRAEAERRNEPISDAEIDGALAWISKGLPQGATLEQVLAAQGVTMDMLRKDVIANERVRKLYEAESGGNEAISDEQISAFYKENIKQFTIPETAESRHVLIGCDAEADAAKRENAKARAEEVRKELAAGADFAEVAKAKSTCPSRQEGGSLGDVERGQMVPEFEKAVFSQNIGEIGPVVETQFGYHVIQVTGRKPGSITPEAEVKDQIREHMIENLKHERFGKFIRGLRAKATITHGDPTGGIIIP